MWKDKGVNMRFKIDKEKLNLKGIGMDKLVIMVLCGIVLVWCSMPEKEESDINEKQQNSEISYNMDQYEKDLEKRLKELLEKVDGVGAVEVMVTIKNTKEKVILTENPYNKSFLNETDAEGGSRVSQEESKDSNTVYVTDDNGNTVPYVVNEIMPEIEGVAIVAKGGETPLVKEKIINVVKSLFDIEANKISISKMK